MRSSSDQSLPVETPILGSAWSVVRRDTVEAFRFAPFWLHEGYVDIVSKFRRTVLGPFWHTLGMGVFVFVIGIIWSAVLSQDPEPYFRYICSGMIVWALIASFVTDGASILILGQQTALSVRYPYIAFAFGHVWRALLLFCHYFVLYIVVMIGTLHPPEWAILWAILGLILLLANGIWISMLIGMLSLRRRDIVPATAAFMSIMIFVTPVFWTKNRLGPDLAFAADFNPLYHLILIVRDPLLGNVPMGVSWAWACGTLVIGSTISVWFYGRYRNRFAYWY